MFSLSISVFSSLWIVFNLCSIQGSKYHLHYMRIFSFDPHWASMDTSHYLGCEMEKPEYCSVLSLWIHHSFTYFSYVFGYLFLFRVEQYQSYQCLCATCSFMLWGMFRWMWSIYHCSPFFWFEYHTGYHYFAWYNPSSGLIRLILFYVF